MPHIANLIGLALETFRNGGEVVKTLPAPMNADLLLLMVKEKQITRPVAQLTARPACK
jgi:hypothetical protein